ncbi:DUF5013 domain-containing protein [Arcticibacter tournemirensis]
MKKKSSFLLIILVALSIYGCEDKNDAVLIQPPVSISITRGGKQLTVTKAADFSVLGQKEKIKIPLGISLSAVTLDSCEVKVSVNQEHTKQLLPSLTNGVLLPEGSYSLPAKVSIPGNRISAPLNLVVNFQAIESNAGKQLVIAITLENPSRHSLDTEKKSVNVVIDADKVIAASELGDVTSKYLKNTGYPFIAAAMAPGGRWGNLADWTANAAAKSHSGYGGFASDDGGVMNMECGWGSPYITNGKIYQTTTLPAGKYTFQVVEFSWKGTKDPAYIVVAEGTSLPDFNAIAGNSLGYAPFSNPVAEFTLAERKEVVLGVCVNYIQNEQGFKIKRFKLVKTE